MLTGCAQLTKLDDKESDKLAEYMAGTVLRYTKNYDEALIYPGEVHETTSANGNTVSNNTDSESEEEIINTQKPAATEAVNTNIQNNISLEELFKNVGDNKYSVSYTGYESHTSYPNDNQYFTIEPANGNKLMVFSFNIKNTQDKSISINLVDKKINYTLKSSSGKSYMPAVSLLANDIQYLKDTIKVNESFKAVIVFEVPGDAKGEDLSMIIGYSGKSSVINIDK